MTMLNLNSPERRSAKQLGVAPIRRAILSVFDKTGIVEFARFLQIRGVHIISTGGTAKLLRENVINVQEVSEVTGFPEMMDGRVKTLHPLIHGGLLGRTDTDGPVMIEHGINPIDLVVVNLYPFAETVKKRGITLAEANKEIDIGGPAMLRSGAKNHERVAVVCSPEGYPALMQEIEKEGGTTLQTRLELKYRVFAATRAYDADIERYLRRFVVKPRKKAMKKAPSKRKK